MTGDPVEGQTDTPPLTGLRIIDLTNLLPGPLATHHLLALGAEVVKIEGPAELGRDDGMRSIGLSDAQRAAGQTSLAFKKLNDGKQIRTLDLRRPEGVAALRALVAEADALVEGFRPGVMTRLGLGWEQLHALNPRLVMCSISGYGQHGPWAARAGHDINYIAMAGVLEQNATIDGELALPNFQIGDLLGGTQAAVSALLAALLGAQRSGRGRHLDVSMTHEVLRHHVLATCALQASGIVPTPGRELLTGGVPCYGVYRTRDARHLAVGALELKFWAALCDAIGRPRWAERHWTRGMVVGGDDAMQLRSELAAVFAQDTLANWLARLDGIDACVTPVLRLDESLAHPLFASREATAQVAIDEG